MGVVGEEKKKYRRPLLEMLRLRDPKGKGKGLNLQSNLGRYDSVKITKLWGI